MGTPMGTPLDFDDMRRQYGTGSISQRKDGLWIGRIEAGWTPRGTRRRITVSAKTETECRKRLRDKQREIARDGIPESGSARATVRTWASEWLDAHQHQVRPKTYATDASAVRRWIVPTIGRRRLSDLGPQDVRTVTAELRKAGRSTTTAAYVHGTLLRMLRAARAEGHRISERVFDVPRPGKAAATRQAIPHADVDALLTTASRLPDGTRWVAALRLGLRQGEALGLTWEALDLAAGIMEVSWQLQALPYLDRAAGTFRVPDGYEARRLAGAHHLVRPKSKAGWRLVPLHPDIAQALAAWRSVAPDSPLVWPRLDGRPRDGAGDRAEWKSLQESAGVVKAGGDRYTLHEARHTVATRLLETGADPHTVTAILGHSSIVTSRGYQHVSTDLARTALDAAALPPAGHGPRQIST